MHKQKRPTSEIIIDIQDFLDGLNETQKQISCSIGVSQSTISRLKGSPAKSRRNLSPGVKRICNYAKIPIYFTKEKNLQKQEELLNTLESVWNGTDEHATALTMLLKAIGRAARC